MAFCSVVPEGTTTEQKKADRVVRKVPTETWVLGSGLANEYHCFVCSDSENHSGRSVVSRSEDFSLSSLLAQVIEQTRSRTADVYQRPQTTQCWRSSRFGSVMVPVQSGQSACRAFQPFPDIWPRAARPNSTTVAACALALAATFDAIELVRHRKTLSLPRLKAET